MTDGIQTYCGDHFRMYTNIKLLCCISETNYNVICQLFFSLKKADLQLSGINDNTAKKKDIKRRMFISLRTKVLVARSCLTLCDSMELQSARLLCPWNSPSRNTEVGSHSLFQGIFPTQGSNPGLLHCRQIVYHLSHHGSP